MTTKLITPREKRTAFYREWIEEWVKNHSFSAADIAGREQRFVNSTSIREDFNRKFDRTCTVTSFAALLIKFYRPEKYKEWMKGTGTGRGGKKQKNIVTAKYFVWTPDQTYLFETFDEVKKVLGDYAVRYPNTDVVKVFKHMEVRAEIKINIIIGEKEHVAKKK